MANLSGQKGINATFENCILLSQEEKSSSLSFNFQMGWVPNLLKIWDKLPGEFVASSEMLMREQLWNTWDANKSSKETRKEIYIILIWVSWLLKDH